MDNVTVQLKNERGTVLQESRLDVLKAPELITVIPLVNGMGPTHAPAGARLAGNLVKPTASYDTVCVVSAGDHVAAGAVREGCMPDVQPSFGRGACVPSGVRSVWVGRTCRSRVHMAVPSGGLNHAGPNPQFGAQQPVWP